MTCNELIEQLELAFPKRYAMEWDNVGLLVGRNQKEVATIYIALDLTDEVLENAIQSKADMILTHHPLLFSPVRRVTDEDFIGRRIVKLLQNDIAYYAMHTNYDVVRMADCAAQMLSLQEFRPLDVTSEDGKGIGTIGQLQERCTVEQFCDHVKEVFQIPSVHVFGDLTKSVERIAVCPGSGKSVIQTAMKNGADLLLTGDLDHHAGIDGVACGITLVDAGHYGLEHIFVEDLEAFLTKHCNGVRIQKAPLQYPFQIC